VTVFVTGATGFLGGVLARQLVAAGHRVRAVVRTPAKADALKCLGVELYAGDVTEKETMRGPMSGVDAVYHVAGWYKIGVRDKRDAFRVNVDGTRHVLELMHELGIRKGVYTSSLAVNSNTRGRVVDESYRFTGTHVSVYDQSKADAHREAEAWITRGVPLVIVQPGLIYGPGDTSGVRTMFIEYLKRKMPVVPTKTAFAWAQVDDVARGHMLAMEKGQPGRNYFVCGPVHTLEEALQMSEQITGIPAPRMRASPGVLKVAAAAMSMLEKVVSVPPAYTAEGLRVVAGVTYIGSNARARRELGWSVRPLRDGLTELLRHEQALLEAPASR
jgi:nucleoside-diphosphate-sugar epimerase